METRHQGIFVYHDFFCERHECMLIEGWKVNEVMRYAMEENPIRSAKWVTSQKSFDEREQRRCGCPVILKPLVIEQIDSVSGEETIRLVVVI